MNKLTRYCQFGLFLSLKIAILTEVTLKASWAQIVPDATLGSESSRVTPTVNGDSSPIDQIEGGAIRRANLFHSFQDFNVNEGQGAFFVNPSGIENILTRVTGNKPSQILGTLGVLGDANLFFINPNGIFFGRNARCKGTGSFVARTASSLTFNNGFEFSANDPQSPPLLTVDIPIGLRFRDHPGSLVNQSKVPQNSNPERLGLSVQDGKNLIFAGGDVRLEGGGLLAQGGQIEIGGLSESGTVGLENNNNIWRLNYPENGTRGNVSFTNNAIVFVGGVGSGVININARNLEVLEGTKIVAGVPPNSGSPETRSGNIEINVTDTMRVDNDSVIANQISEGGFGTSGDIILNVGSLQVINSGTIRTVVYGQGNTGRIIINATGNIELDNGLITNRINEGAVGNTEGIFITTGNLVITNGGLISSIVAGRGNTDQINIQARNGITLSGIDETGKNSSSITSTVAYESIGNTGDILINAPSLSITDGASINTATQGTGSSGNIYLQVRGNVFISGEAPTGIHTDSLLAGSGKAGNIFITAVAFNLANGAQLTATSSGDGNGGDINIIAKDAIFNGGNDFLTGIYTMTPGGYPQLGLTATGKAGNINIIADSVNLTDGVLFTTLSTTAKGAGDITINAVDSVSIREGSSLLTSGISAGNSGNITIQAGNKVSLDGVGNSFSRLLTALPSETNLSFLADIPIFNNPSSSVISTAAIDLPSASSNNRGQGGNIEITARSVSVSNGAFLSTTTLGEGNGGNIIIKATDRVSFDGAAPLASDSSLTNESLISNFNTEIRPPSGASSDVGAVRGTVGKGNGGDIIIETRSLSVTGGAQLSTLTSGQGDAGNIIIQAFDGVDISNSDITLPAPSGLLSTTEQGATGKGGEIRITTGNLRVADSSILTARTNSAFNGGNINIQANRLELTNGGQLLTSAFSQGDAGNVKVNASDRITISGQSTNNTFSTNDTAASGIFVRSQQAETGAGEAGRIEVNTPTLILENGASLTSASASVNGGDIFLQVPDLIIMRDNSSISASAGTVEAGGNGGNINISSDILATFENSDITANAFEGNGGNVNINAQSIFGTEFRPQETSDSDITASSTFGQQGEVRINLSGIDVNRGLADLPEIIVDPDRLIAQNPCTLGKKSQFVDQRRGGLPTSPSDILTSDASRVSLVAPVVDSTGNTRVRSRKAPIRSESEPIVPATGLVINAQGEIILAATERTDSVNRIGWRTSAGCQ
ncbi:filamentous hemagglutinin N-terminal domain-containing protein [Planktothrix agardhii]|uniref:two-partner secretion domain-containing protein n=1 Tax=Planktothrix agardhii TaxID=1160 RepID=UPI001F43E60C|nr:filamentous hemagglutinin N-terminal domain-containing protein [Planktothrix agardhii]MCF3647662.1 filamentous hemagglutinin N-terminal domain-containing protein [Planktothrix agardhii 1026]